MDNTRAPIEKFCAHSGLSGCFPQGLESCRACDHKIAKKFLMRTFALLQRCENSRELQREIAREGAWILAIDVQIRAVVGLPQRLSCFIHSPCG
jgi:hypothetical protein